MTNKQIPKVLWLTNLPAPYRFKIWDQMSESVDLTVTFLLKRKNWRNWLEPKGVKWKAHYLSLNSLRVQEYDLIPGFRGARKLLQNIDITIIGGWESPMFIRTILLAKKRKIPVIQFYESFSESHRFKTGLVARIRRWVLLKPDKYIVISKGSKESLINIGVNSSKILTLYNPVDVSWFDRFAQNHRTPVTPGHRYLYVGQLIERKNIASILRSFAAIKNDGDTLTIVGDGPLNENLKKLSFGLGIAKSVDFVGQKVQQDLAEFYAKSETLILASSSEVWGLVVNEALASGLHVIVSDVCGVAEFVRGMNGAYICSTDQKSLQYMMMKSSQQWTGYIEEPEILQYTPEKFADYLLKFIRDLTIST